MQVAAAAIRGSHVSNTFRKVRVLHAIRQGEIGGGESHVLDLVGHLDVDKYESVVLAFSEGEMVTKLRAYGVVCEVLSSKRPFDLLVWPRVKKIIKKYNIDLVHAHGTRACSNVFWAAKSVGVPLIYTVHGWSFHSVHSALSQKIRLMSEKFLVKQTNLNILVSKSNQKEGLEKLNIPNSAVIHNGINFSKFDPSRKFLLSRKDLSVPEGKIIVGMIARLTEQKDPLTFIKAAWLVNEKQLPIHFVIVGGGELEERCKSLTNELGIEDQITFAGFRSDIPAVLNLMDIYCLPSLWEGLPIGLIEAMAMNKAVIATPVDGTQELIEDEITGRFMNMQEPFHLAEIIAEVSANHELRHRLGKKAFEFVRKNFSVDKMALQTSSLYEKLVLPK